ncbi:uncharacterized protein LOC109950821 [Prunus persica]|uniref:uncharacterized protein LOC109950821 n=1 Tax=Prunus persica TaxID=3760 RepID=UPI0009ABA569|nr:uncharacterized protein LOC109950821 [Prunus persica]
MPIDKSWMQSGRSSEDYFAGVESFLNYAYNHVKPDDSKIFCPCSKCSNRYRHLRYEAHKHLLYNGIKLTYTTWYLHGEGEDEDSDESDSENDGHDVASMEQDDDMHGLIEEGYPQDPNGDAHKFYKLLEEAEQLLYVGCESYFNLSFVVNLMHIKGIGTMSNKAFGMLLTLLKNAFPFSDKLPTTTNGAKKIISDLGLHYDKIDACNNDCIIYYKEHANRTQCPTCKLLRWKRQGKGSKKKGKRVPWKDRVKDGVLRHPADYEAWKSFNQIHESFGMEPRNVRLGLATDGFNPFGNMNLHYSIWPVLIYPYNLPPWMCMKEPYVFMTLLIPGPKGPCHDINVYMRPLIDELRTLWEIGVETYDIYVKQNFQMRAALLWTINDYPAYAYMSGWSTFGKLACPYCASNTSHRRLSHGSKTCYLGHRRFLLSDHVWHNQGSQFDNTRERRLAPKRPSGDDVINELSELREITHGKDGKKHTIFGFGKDHNWKKHSIFFQLPYWKTLLVRHNLDVMHIQKNVFENVIGTMMSIDGKTKDSLNARLDLQEMGIRQRYHLEERDNGKLNFIPGDYTLSNDDNKALCQWLMELKVPDGYSGNLSRCVNASERNISGMKTHDSHVFLERLLPFVARDLLPKDVSEPLIELSYFFKELCAKVLRENDLNLLDNQIVLTLCKLEKIFPPAFFDIMIHLTCHLAWEAKVAGPVQFRWMYPVERYLHKLKTYVRNKAHPEGSIAEGVLGDECLIFCSRYLHRVETKFNKRDRNDDGGQPSYDTSPFLFSQHLVELLGKVEHKNILIQSTVDNVEESHRLQFSNWISKRVTELYNDGERDENKKTQNSGVMVKGENQIDDVPWYGTLVDIVELRYTEGNRVVLFNCDWYDTARKGTGYKIDRYGIIIVNTTRKLNTQEPFVLASQATQVFYVKGVKNKIWSFVVETNPRNAYEMTNDEIEPYQEAETQSQSMHAIQNDVEDNEID